MVRARNRHGPAGAELNDNRMKWWPSREAYRLVEEGSRRASERLATGGSHAPRPSPVHRAVRRLRDRGRRARRGSSSDADAASCVRFSGGRFDAPGNDNYAQYLNGEYVKFKNYCSTSKVLTGWKSTTTGRSSLAIPSGFRIGAGVTVTLYSGRAPERRPGCTGTARTAPSGTTRHPSARTCGTARGR